MSAADACSSPRRSRRLMRRVLTEKYSVPGDSVSPPSVKKESLIVDKENIP